MRKEICVLLIFMICLLCGCAGAKEPEAFTNRQGTSETVCAHEGCGSLISPTGDTLYCPEHSGKCRVCGCCIDEGKVYCTACTVELISSAGESAFSDRTNQFK